MITSRYTHVASALFVLLTATHADAAFFYYRHPLQGITPSAGTNQSPSVEAPTHVEGEIGEVIHPFSGLRISDPEGHHLKVIVELDNPAAGSLSGAGMVADGPSKRLLEGTGSKVTSTLRGASFLPTEGRLADGASEDVTFHLTAVDGAGAMASASVTLTLSALAPSGPVIWAVGRNATGQLGLGDTDNRAIAEPLPLTKDWVTVSPTRFNGTHTAALTASGDLWTWGYNVFAQLGHGHTTNLLEPTLLDSGVAWSFAEAGRNYSVGLKVDGSLWTWGWGSNATYQLGLGDDLTRNAPARIGTDTDWAKIFAGRGYAMGIKVDGSLWNWGTNASGQLGYAGVSVQPTPAQVGSETDWMALALGDDHSLAIKTDGSLWSWGAASFEVLGRGNLGTGILPIPERVGSHSDWVSISTSRRGSFGVRADGSLWVWGYLGSEGLGVTRSDYPEQVMHGMKVRSIHAGNQYTMVLVV